MARKHRRGWHSLRRKFASDLMDQPLKSKRGRAVAAAGLVTAVGVLWFVQGKLDGMVEAQQVQASMFQVDPFWPKP